MRQRIKRILDIAYMNNIECLILWAFWCWAFRNSPEIIAQLFKEELANYGEADYTIICAPGFKCDPERDGVHSEACIAIDYEAHTIIIAGSQ
jgi:hypothetical protein